MLLVVVMTMMSATPAFAASGAKTDPYSYIWLDESTGIWNIQHYVYDKSENAYYIADFVTLNGNKLVDANGNQIFSNIKAMSANLSNADSPTVAFYNGKLYFIFSNGEVGMMTSSTAATYAKANGVTNAKTFTLDADSLATKVASKNLSSLTFSGSYARNTSGNQPSNPPVIDREGSYVRTYAFEGDPTKIVYDAYKDDELLLSTYCKGANVWLETEKVLLSESCVGAKFVGYSKDYFIILYDQDGTVYAFAYGVYDKALPISLGEEIMSYKKDSNGFIESITTVRKTYNLDALLEQYGYNNIYGRALSYVDNYVDESIAYDSDGNEIVSIERNNLYLYWDGDKLSSSYRSTYMGFTDEGYPVWINRDKDLYYHDGSTAKLIAENVTRLRYDEDGFVTQYVVGSKTHNLKF